MHSTNGLVLYTLEGFFLCRMRNSWAISIHFLILKVASEVFCGHEHYLETDAGGGWQVNLLVCCFPNKTQTPHFTSKYITPSRKHLPCCCLRINSAPLVYFFFFFLHWILSNLWNVQITCVPIPASNEQSKSKSLNLQHRTLPAGFRTNLVTPSLISSLYAIYTVSNRIDRGCLVCHVV